MATETLNVRGHASAVEFFIEDNELAPLKGKVAVITGTSSGIGLATLELLLQLGAKVVGGDRNPSKISHDNFSFVQTDVTHWPDLVALFKHAKQTHGRIDHVFSNAGISGRANYLTETFDSAGELEEPNFQTLDIDLRGMINTSYLALYHFRHQEPPGGSIVCTASAAAFQRFRIADYTAAKHGVLGWMRGMIPNLLEERLPIRVNAVAPSWTLTGLVPGDVVDKLEAEWQTPAQVARSVAVLMADERRQGQLIYSWAGRFMELEEGVLLPAVKPIIGLQDEDAVIGKLHRLASNIGYV